MERRAEKKKKKPREEGEEPPPPAELEGAAGGGEGAAQDGPDPLDAMESGRLPKREEEEEEGEGAHHPPPEMPGKTKADEDQGAAKYPKPEHEWRQFSDRDPSQYGIDWQDAGSEYVAPERAVLPDLQRLLATLEDPSSQLNSENTPDLFDGRPQETVVSLREELAAEELPRYAQQFEDDVRDDVLMVGHVSVQEIEEEERRLREEHVAFEAREAAEGRRRREELLRQEGESKRRAAATLKDRRLMMQRQQAAHLLREKQLMERLHKAFRRGEAQLVSSLDRRKAEVKTMYGDLVESAGQYGGARGRRWKVDWDRTPQPLQLHLTCLRGVKDKLPPGRYSVTVSLYNRLGGHVIRWSRLRGQQWGGTTVPVWHDGHFYNTELKLDQSVFTVLPSKPDLRPGMVLVLEVYLLRGDVVPSDRVVGWGCFPVCDGDFNVIEGKYKAPLLRGEVDPLVDKHEQFEQLMSSDLDHWLANVYFSVNKLPRYLAGQKEYEVELAFSSGLLSFPDRTRGAEDRRDGDVPQHSGASQADSQSFRGSQLSVGGAGEASSSDTSSFKKQPLAVTSSASASDDGHAKPQVSVLLSRKLAGEKKLDLRAEGAGLLKGGVPEDDASDYGDDDMFGVRPEGDYTAVEGQPGLFYRRHVNNAIDVYQRRQVALVPKTALLSPPARRQTLTPLEQLEQHSFNVKDDKDVRKVFTGKGRLHEEGWERFNYVGRQFLSEVGLSEWRSVEFWGMLLLLALTFWLRLYLHYTAQWLLLAIMKIPINRFDLLPYTVYLNYQQSLLQARQEIFVVVMGPFSCVLVMALLTLFAWIMQKLRFFPDLLSKFVLAFGIQALLDPLLIAVIDLCMPDRRWYSQGGPYPVADFAKLWYKFSSLEGLGLAGIFITVFLYFMCCFCAGAILYMYFLRLHNNGRLLDIYWRLHGNADQFFVPHDLELSNQELSYILRKSEQWRGEEGERRKVAVYDYIWEEENVEETVWDENASATGSREGAGPQEVTTHVSVHTLHLDGLRELYRHFLRLPDGGIVEVFGDLSSLGMDKEVLRALEKGARGVEGLGSLTSLQDAQAPGPDEAADDGAKAKAE